MQKPKTGVRRYIWISKKPLFAPIDLESGRKLFIGFSKGNTYIKAIHGLIGHELIKQTQN